MSHRAEPENSSRMRVALWAAAVWILAAVFSSAGAGEGETKGAGHAVFDFYAKVISPVDGNRCLMYPSCSHYARQSVRRHGAVVGWIMAMDRLVRCGRDEKQVSPSRIEGRKKYIYDPVENNDFWWCGK